MCLLNKKIKELLEELAEECKNEKVTLVCTAHSGGESLTAVYGGITNLAYALAIQDKKLQEKFEIPPETLRSTALRVLDELQGKKSEKKEHTFVVDNVADLKDIFNRIVSGEFDE